jgi:FdhD protein
MTTNLDGVGDRLGLGRLGYAEPLLSHGARRWVEGREVEAQERIAEEVPVVLVYNGVAHVVMMATPADLEDFALGFSITEELIRAPAELLDLQVVKYGQGIEVQMRVSKERETEISERSRRLSGRTGCGICGSDSIAAVLRPPRELPAGPVITAAAVHAAMDDLSSRQTLNTQAGTVHAAGWATLAGAVVLVREDVGRHNALDKLIGALVRANQDPRQGFIVLTSRASFEMVQKAVVFGAPLVASISGPTGLAVRVAEQAGLTLVGFTRPGRHTVYAHPGRLNTPT